MNRCEAALNKSKTMEKKDRYELLCKQVESLAAGETNVVGVLANVSAAMKTMFPEEFFWVGFYIVASPPALPCREGASLRSVY